MKKILLMCQQCRFREGALLELSPARCQLIHELKKKNYEIYVFLPGIVTDKKVKDEIDYFVNTADLKINDMRRKIREISPDFIIAFTYEDVEILYSLPWVMKRTVYIYYNLEIHTPNNYYVQSGGKIKNSFHFLRNKWKEIIFTRKCKLFVIQDNLRKKVSARFFICHPNTLLIVNSYKYNGKDKVREDCSRMIYSGGLNRFQLKSLFEKADALPDLPITFSGWKDEWFTREYKRLSKTHPSIKLNTKVLSPDEFTEFLKQFAVGFIWYSTTKDENIDNIGMSSGKFFKHLSLGQPVIVNECPGLSKVVRKYRLGIVINDASELKAAYDCIMENYTYYQNNVIRVYKSKFDYQKIIQPFLQRLEEM